MSEAGVSERLFDAPKVVPACRVRVGPSSFSGPPDEPEKEENIDPNQVEPASDFFFSFDFDGSPSVFGLIHWKSCFSEGATGAGAAGASERVAEGGGAGAKFSSSVRWSCSYFLSASAAKASETAGIISAMTSANVGLAMIVAPMQTPDRSIEVRLYHARAAQ